MQIRKLPKTVLAGRFCLFFLLSELQKKKPPVKNNGDNQNILKPGGFQWNEKIVTGWQNSVN
jgi:hypothetical protein